MRRIAWSVSAVDELSGIIAYIARQDPEAAKRVADRLERAVQSLAEYPTGRKGRVSGTFEKVVAGLPYIIAYALDEGPAGSKRLTVLRVIHSARGWPDDGWPAG